MKKERVARGRPVRPTLSRDLVLSAAVEMVDRDGVEALTMRGLAGALDVEAMSLYHHLPGKDALLDGLVESVAGEIRDEIAPLAQPAHWRASVRQRCLAARKVMLRHPWAPGLIATRKAVPPAIYRHYEAVLATMIQGGFSYHLAHRALHALGSMALGFVQELFSPGSGNASAEVTAAQFAAIAVELPHIAAMVVSEIHANDGKTLGWCDSQAEFEFTLELLLDGLERRLGEEKRRRPRDARPVRKASARPARRAAPR